MSSSTLMEVFGHIVFNFTRGVTNCYNPEEPEFTAESFGYNPLESTGREWYYHPVEHPSVTDLVKLENPPGFLQNSTRADKSPPG